MENKFMLYNTLSRKVETIIPREEGKIAMYTCGPTVYHFAHIGNLKNYINHDILDKTLRYLGYDVKRAMNITDVGHLSSDADTGDDKMVRSAKEEKKSVLDIAKYYTDLFFKDLENDKEFKRPETVNLLNQTRKTLKNVHKFIKNTEVVDANSLLRSAFENLIMGMMIYENTSTYKEFINLSIDDKTRQYTKPQKLRNDINMRNRQKQS